MTYYRSKKVVMHKFAGTAQARPTSRQDQQVHDTSRIQNEVEPLPNHQG